MGTSRTDQGRISTKRATIDPWAARAWVRAGLSASRKSRLNHRTPTSVGGTPTLVTDPATRGPAAVIPRRESTAVYAVATLATLNLALVAAAVVAGTVFSWQRHRTGGVMAAILTHASWSTLILFFLPL